MERIQANLKLATTAINVLNSVNLEENKFTDTSFSQHKVRVQIEDCPEAYSFINSMQAKLKLRMQKQVAFESDNTRFTTFQYLTSTQLEIDITIATPKQ